MPGGDERDGGVFRDRSGWRIGFALAWCVLLASTIAASLLLGGASTARGVFLVGVAVGEFVLALISSVLLEHTVFPPPRQERSVAPPRDAVRDREERLAQVERLRRALEETRGNLESNVQYLQTMAEVFTVITGTLDPEELYRT